MVQVGPLVRDDTYLILILIRKSRNPSETNTHWAVSIVAGQEKQTLSVDLVVEMFSFHLRVFWDTIPEKNNILAMLWAVRLISRGLSGTFLGRCAGRFQHKTMFISIILRLLSSKLLLAHCDSRWATPLSGKWTNYSWWWWPSEWCHLHILTGNTFDILYSFMYSNTLGCLSENYY